jgi:hypothetical protein
VIWATSCSGLLQRHAARRIDHFVSRADGIYASRNETTILPPLRPIGHFASFQPKRDRHDTGMSQQGPFVLLEDQEGCRSDSIMTSELLET